MARNETGRRWSLYFLFLFAILAVLVIFSSDWLATTAKELAEKNAKRQSELRTDPGPEPQPGQADRPDPQTEASAPEPVTDPVPSVPTQERTEPEPQALPPSPLPMLGGWAPSKKDEQDYKKLVEAMRAYLSLDEDVWQTRKVAEALLARNVHSNAHPLVDGPALRWLAAQSRSFGPGLADRRAAKKASRTVVARGRFGTEFRDAKHWFHLRAPREARRARMEQYPRAGPWPLVFALPEARDVNAADGAGKSWFDRHWPAAHGLHDWYVLLALSSDGSYSNDEVIDPVTMLGVYRLLWTAEHVDFDRVVLDGRDDALLAAVTSSSTMWAGVILRGLELKDGAIQSDKLRKSISNLAGLPVYVVDQPAVARALQAAGHDQVTSGGGGDALLAWMNARRRTTAKTFRWHIAGIDQALAQWINIDRRSGDGPGTLTASVKANVIELTASGIAELSLFLDDEIVDLDQVVKVYVNGELVIEDLIPMRRGTRETTRRDLRAIFEHPVINVRKHRYYGWLKAAQLTRISVP